MTDSGTITRLSAQAPHATLPVGSVDVLPRLAAAAWADRPALRTAQLTVTFAELDDLVSRLASGLRGLLGGDSSMVVLSAELTGWFPLAYYGIARSGNLVVPVSPRLGAEVLRCLLDSTAARAVVLGRTMYERVRPALVGAAGIEHVVLLDGACAGADVPTCAGLSVSGNLLVEPRDRDENEPAAVRLSAGPAGHVPSAGLTHYQLKKDAAVAVAEQRLASGAVVINGLPSYTQTDLNAGVLAGVTQVLCGSPHPTAVGQEAVRAGARQSPGAPPSARQVRPGYLVLDKPGMPAGEQVKAVAS